MKVWLLIFVALIAAFFTILWSRPDLRIMMFGMPEERVRGTTIVGDTTEVSIAEVEARLLAVGLNPAPVLGDTAVSGHLVRLQAGEVSGATLLAYADNLAVLNAYGEAKYGQIPTDFWDVDTAALKADGWSSYTIVAALSGPEGRDFLDLLLAAFERFKHFKQSDGGDTAVDTALDLFELAIVMVDNQPETALLEHSPFLNTPAKSTIYLWQNLVAGTTRHNPLTHRPAYSHGFASRFNVATIWQYEVGVAMSIGKVWGVSGFDPAFVGPASNDNQIEHMSVSITAQAVLGEHLSTLAAFEAFETLISHAKADASVADEALNKAIAEYFTPHFEADLRAAVKSLRLALKP